MSLTEEERRRLDALAEDLSRDNPELGRALSGRRRGWRWSSAVVAGLLVIVALPLLVVGVGLTALVVFALGSFALIGAGWAGVVAVAGRSLRGRRGRR
jgi:hypothetical protein